MMGMKKRMKRGGSVKKRMKKKKRVKKNDGGSLKACLLYTSPSPRD